MLTALAVQPGSAVATDSLAYEVWGDCQPGKAKRAFERIVTEDTMPKPMKGTAISINELNATNGGTKLVRRLGKPGSRRSLVDRVMVPAIRRLANSGFGAFVEGDSRLGPEAATTRIDAFGGGHRAGVHGRCDLLGN